MGLSEFVSGCHDVSHGSYGLSIENEIYIDFGVKERVALVAVQGLFTLIGDFPEDYGDTATGLSFDCRDRAAFAPEHQTPVLDDSFSEKLGFGTSVFHLLNVHVAAVC